MKKKKIKSILATIFYCVVSIVMIGIIVGFIGLNVYVRIKYANVPVGKVPFWVYWFIFNKG